jgi:hypothetical protein
MIWKAKYTKVEFLHGTRRLKRMFAWLPTYIDGDKIWLEGYEILQAYVVAKHIVVLDPTKPKEITEFLVGTWTDISKRLIK